MSAVGGEVTGQHPAVAHLTAALDRAETTARAAEGDSGPEWVDTGEAVYVRGSNNPVAVGPWTGYLPDGVRALIAAWGPDVVLRQVAAVRAVLDAHSPTAGVGWVPRGSLGRSGYGTIDPACTTCGTDDEYAVPWPCATVLALAEGWGWDGGA